MATTAHSPRPTIQRSSDIVYSKVGNHRGRPRIWFEGRRLRSIGALPGTRYEVRADAVTKTLTIVISESGDRTVSARADSPIIDINNGIIAAALGATATRIRAVFAPGKIVITVSANEAAEHERRDRLAAKLADGDVLTVGSVFHGAGILDAAVHQGLADACIRSEMKFAVELEERFLETSVRNNPAWAADGIAVAGSVDEVDVTLLPRVDVLVAGIPCTGASLSGRAKLLTESAEAHPTAGHLFVPFLGIVKAVQPAIIVIENVVPYRTTPSWTVLRSCLEVLGYDVTETVLNAFELGALEKRDRFAAVAVTKGSNLSIDLGSIVAPVDRPASVAAILDPPGTEHRWSTCDGLRAKAMRDKAKVEKSGRGTGFQMQILTAAATFVPVITKDYHKWRSTDPKLAGHPTDPRLLRQFSPAEHARIKGIPFALVAGESPTTTHQMLGQSVCFPAFQAFARLIGTSLAAVTVPRRAITTVRTIAHPLAPTPPTGQLSLAL